MQPTLPSGFPGIPAAIFMALPLVCAGVTATAAEAVPAADAQPRFDVWEFQVAGSERLESPLIERAVYPFLGPEKTIDDVEAARTALEALFRDRGFGTVLVNIPEQDVNEGVVRLDVVEGRVERLRVTGSRYFSLGRIKARVPALAPGQLPDLPQVQQELAALNKRSPDRTITPVLRPGRGPGAVEVELKVDDTLPLHGALEINDQYTRDTTRTRLNASLRYDNLWQREHSVGLSFQISPEDPNEVKVLSGTYLFRPDVADLLVAIYGVKSDSDVSTLGGDSGAVGVIGNGGIVGARVIKPLTRIGSVYHNLTVGLDYKDFSDAISPDAGGGFETPISYTKFVTGYGGFWIEDKARLQYNLEANWAVRGLGNTEKEFEGKRFQAKPNFLYVRGTAALEATLPYDSRLHFDLTGQVASGPLISNEQASLGGVETVRGYLETQVLADDALQARLELRSPSVTDWHEWRWIREGRIVVFVDAAHGRIIDPLPNQDSSFSLAGTGFGLRVDGVYGLASELDWALPLIENGEIDSGESRLHFRFGYEF